MDKNGTNAQSIHQPVGRHYDLPMISYRDALWPLIEQGKMTWSDLSPDDVHPNDYGHSVAAAFIKSYLSDLYADLDNIGSEAAAVPTPLISDAYENARILTSANFEATRTGSFKVDNNAFFQFKDGWTVTKGTDSIEFDIKKVKNVFILYNRSPKNTMGKVKVQVNFGVGQEIDSYFAQLDYASYQQVSATKNAGNQKVVITPMAEDGKNEFRILGILVS